jgi:hypothetical protein
MAMVRCAPGHRFTRPPGLSRVATSIPSSNRSPAEPAIEHGHTVALPTVQPLLDGTEDWLPPSGPQELHLALRHHCRRGPATSWPRTGALQSSAALVDLLGNPESDHPWPVGHTVDSNHESRHAERWSRTTLPCGYGFTARSGHRAGRSEVAWPTVNVDQALVLLQVFRAQPASGVAGLVAHSFIDAGAQHDHRPDRCACATAAAPTALAVAPTALASSASPTSPSPAVGGVQSAVVSGSRWHSLV